MTPLQESDQSGKLLRLNNFLIYISLYLPQRPKVFEAFQLWGTGTQNQECWPMLSGATTEHLPLGNLHIKEGGGRVFIVLEADASKSLGPASGTSFLLHHMVGSIKWQGNAQPSRRGHCYNEVTPMTLTLAIMKAESSRLIQF